MNGVRIEMFAVYTLRTPDQIHQGQFVEREHFIDRPPAGRNGLTYGSDSGERASLHERPCLKTNGNTGNDAHR